MLATSSHATAATSDFSPRTSLLRQTLSLNATSSIPGAPIQNSFRAPSLVATSTPPTTASTPSTTLPTHLSATTSPSILRYALEAVLTNMVSRRNGMSVGAFYFQGDVGVLEGDEREVVGGIPLVIIGLRERETPTSTFAPPSTAHDGSTVATALNELANVMSESTATIESTPFSPMNSPNNDVTSNPIPPQDPPLAPPPSAASLDAEDASNSPSQGWLMYIIGGPQTADALEQLNDRPITAEQQNIARTQLFEIRGQYTLILRDGATELSDSLPPPDASDSTPTNPANAANPFRFPNSFAAILSSLLTEASDTPLTSGTPTLDRYEMFHRLADFLGPARPRNISKDTVERLLPATTIAVHLKSPLLEVSLAHAPPCPICLVKYQAVDSIRVLPCDHYFHTPCIDAWVCGHVNNCPLCRSDAAVEASTSLDP